MAMNRTFVALGSLFALLAVALGAFGTHSLRPRLTERALEIWETAGHYHLIHAVALVLVGLVCGQTFSKLAHAAGWLFTIGILIFGGTLYVLALTDIRWLGAITPLGGAAFMVGWICLFLSVVRKEG